MTAGTGKFKKKKGSKRKKGLVSTFDITPFWDWN